MNAYASFQNMRYITRSVYMTLWKHRKIDKKKKLKISPDLIILKSVKFFPGLPLKDKAI